MLFLARADDEKFPARRVISRTHEKRTKHIKNCVVLLTAWWWSYGVCVPYDTHTFHIVFAPVGWPWKIEIKRGQFSANKHDAFWQLLFLSHFECHVRTFLPLLHNPFSCTSPLLQWSMILLPRPKIHDSWNLNDFETFYLQTSWFILDIPKTIAPSPPLNLKPVPHYVAFWALYQT